MTLHLVTQATKPATSVETQPTSGKTRRARATLTLTPGIQFGDDYYRESGQVIGCLESGNFKVFFDNGLHLGMIAYILNVGSVDVHGIHLCAKLYAHHVGVPHDILAMRDEEGTKKQEKRRHSEFWFLSRFASALQRSIQNHKHDDACTEHREREHLLPALAMVPEALQVNRTLPRYSSTRPSLP